MIARIKAAAQGWVATQQGKGQLKAHLNGYADSLGRMLLDMRLEQHELAALNSQQRSLGLEPGDIQKVHREAVTHISKHVLADGVVTHDELSALVQIAQALGVQWSDLPQQHVRAYHIAHQFMEIQTGNLPVLSPSSCRINAEVGELVHIEIGGQILDERTVARQYAGGHRGFSVRVCKGVSYRFGSSRGRSIPVTAIVPVDQGVLSLTSKRIAFIGHRRSFSVPWAKVLSAEPMSDGVHLAFQSRTKSALVQYEDPTYSEIIAALISHFTA